ncbi:MAG: hypothetical protein RR444_01175 [Oscillospiraceae bacterium]
MSEYDQYKKERQKLIEATKVKMSTPNGGAGVEKEDYQPLKPTTFKGKWSNYWYHYKWLTFGSLFGGILIFMFAWQMIFKPVYDARMVVLSELPFDSMVDSFEVKLSDLATDYTQNGKIELDFMSIQQDLKGENSLSPEMVQAGFVKLSASLSTLDSYIYLVDESSYDYLKEMEINLMDLSGLADPEKLDKADRYSLKDTKLAEKLELSEILDTMYLCFIDYDSLDEKRQNKKDIKANYERDIAFFKELLAYK